MHPPTEPFDHGWLDRPGGARSTPWAVDDLPHLDDLTTAVLVADLEALRAHLGAGSWLVHGVSWGSTLALAPTSRPS